MSSNQSHSLTIESIAYDRQNNHVRYQLPADDGCFCFDGMLSETHGIRSIVISDSFEFFLRPFLAENPNVMKEIVRITWALIDGELVEFPLTI